ncbi:molybdenum cofactor guanylyltransferase MobA [Ottowia sp.]|jgi:molybdopterin-guanine dinucleotide biosynthesis protein A|uniref:molybdenum cofactor guanylyltransferase MobA n=1 Tax=Ottowia sp. TaxID=1898956 RepID=UPI0025CF1D87|nr:molybdenum cofactor guanylyltransferase MobA [Ottowia sp.]MBK6612672.1 molybdenum cofactor guanylyltransferase MobA [Ottowia sp.]MBK6748197.1 molybdenum cofactor guanylyltransferase MobA [Ottowia sp.]
MASPPPVTSRDITALLLAGGQGTRMGRADKGLQPFRGVPLALHALRRLRRQSLPPAAVMISANRHLADYAAFGAPVWPDAVPGHAGPLAGFLAALEHCQTPLLLTLPCDVPHFPLSLCERLAQALCEQTADIAMAAALGGDEPGAARLRTQPVFCLLRATLRDSLAGFMQAGGRKVDAWAAQHRRVIVPFDAPSDDPRAFANANTLEELRRLERAENQSPFTIPPCPTPPPSPPRP